MRAVKYLNGTRGDCPRKHSSVSKRLAAVNAAIVAVAALGLLPLPAVAQQEDAFLIRDIFTGGANSSDPQNFTVLGAFAYFSATDGVGAGASGRELWRTDGTNAGTTLVANINPGTASSNPAAFATIGTYVFFTAANGTAGVEPWVTDGTTTQLLSNVNGANTDSGVAEVTVSGNNVFFRATGPGTGGIELYVTNGTPAGTILTRDLRTTGGRDSTPSLITAIGGGRVVFEAAGNNATDGNVGTEPYVSDGTAAGTFLLRDIVVGNGSSNIDDFEYVPALGVAFFDADSAGNGAELWKTDGTVVGTVLVTNINPGAGNSNPAQLTSANGKLYFSATNGTTGIEPWVSDGTAGGTFVLGNLNTVGDSNPTQFVAVGSTVYFTATGTGVGLELYKTDGTPGSATLVSDLNPGLGNSSPANLTPFGGLLFFSATDGTSGVEPYVTDGTTVTRLMDISPGAGSSTPLNARVAGNYLFFSATAGGAIGRELYRTNGTVAGTVLLTDINTGAADSTPQYLTLFGADLIILSATGSTGIEPYAVDYVFPTVDYLDRLDTDPTNAASVNWEIRFSEGVSGVDAADFQLVRTGITGGSITAVTSVGANNRRWTITVSGYSGQGTLGLNFADNDSVTDLKGSNNPVAGIGVGNGSFTGQVYTIDVQPPSVQSSVRANPDPTAASTVDFTVTFSEVVTGVGVGDFGLTTTGGISGASIVSRTPPPPSAVFTVTVNTGSGNGTIRLDVNDNDSIVDALLNPLGGPGANNGAFTSGQSYTVDKSPPTVQSISRIGASPTNAGNLTFDVTFTKSVTGVDAGDFAVAMTGVAGASVTGVVGSGSNYMVTVDSGSGDGTVGLNLIDNDSIVDALSQPLGGAGAGNGNFTGESYTIDKTVPVVLSITRLNTNPTNASSVDFLVTFSEPVSGVNAAPFPDFQLTTTGVVGASISSRVNGVGTTTVTVNTGTGSGTVRLDLIDDGTILDGVGNQLGGPGAGNGDFTTGEVYTVDRTNPTVLSIIRLDPSPSSAATVDYLVTFSEAVSGVNLADFTLTTTGVSGASLVSRTNLTSSTTLVTVNTGSGNGTIRLDVTDDDSIVDSAANPLGGPGAGNGNFTTGEVYTINKSVPTVVSIVRVNSSPTNAASVDYTVTFSESVTGVDAGDFALTTSGVAGASVSGVAGSGSTYTASVNTGSGDGTLRLDVTDNDSIVNASLQPLGGAGAGNGNFTGGEVYTLDKSVPVVDSIVTLDANPSNGATVNFLVTFSENVTNVGVADFALTTTGVAGASIVSRTNLTPSTTQVLVNTGSGDGTIRLDLIDDDSIQDSVGNRLGGTGLGNGDYTTGSVYTVDRTNPAVVSITRVDPNPSNAATVDFLVTFSEAVSGVNLADFSLTTTGVTGASLVSRTNLTPSTTRVTVNTGSGNGTIRLDLVDDDSITDTAANILGGAGAGNGNFASGEVYTIDKTIPSVVSVVRASPNPTSAASVNYTVTFSEAVTGVDAGDFTLAVTGLSGVSVSSVAGSGSTYTVTVNTGSGDGTLRLDVTDNDSIVDGSLQPLGGVGAGNGNFAGGEVYIVDKSVPVVTSIVGLGPNPNNGASVVFLVTFSEDVSNVDLTDFVLNTTGISGASITTVTNVTASTTQVTANTGTGDGTIRLDLLDDDSIQDVNSNRLGGAGAGNGNFTTGTVYTIDKTNPAVQSIVRMDPNPTGAATVNFQVTFSENVSGVDIPDFALTVSSIVGAFVSNVTQQNASTYTVTVNTGSGNGTLRLDLVDNDSIVDGAANRLGGTGNGNGSYSSGETYTIDKSFPVVNSIVRSGTNPTNAASRDFTVTFSANVTGVDSTDFTLAASGVTGAALSSVSQQTPSTYLVTVNTGTGDGTLRLDLVDDDSIQNTFSSPLGGAGAGNGNYAGGESYTIDKTAPTVAISGPSAGSTTVGPVTYTITFTGGDAVPMDNTFVTLNLTGTASGFVSVSGTGPASRTVTIDTITGDGTIGISIASGAATDNASNASAAAGPSATFSVASNLSLPLRTWPLLLAMLIVGLWVTGRRLFGAGKERAPR